MTHPVGECVLLSTSTPGIWEDAETWKKDTTLRLNNQESKNKSFKAESFCSIKGTTEEVK